MHTIIEAARGIASNDNFIAGLQGGTRYALAAQSGCSTPFHGPTLHDAFGIGSFNVNEGVRISEIEFHNLAGELDLLAAIVSGADGVMCICGQTKYQSGRNGEDRQVTFHGWLVLRLLYSLVYRFNERVGRPGAGRGAPAAIIV